MTVTPRSHEVGLLINGGLRTGHGTSIELVDPYRRDVVARVSCADERDLEEAVQAAQAAREHMAQMARTKRAEILHAAATHIDASTDEISREISRQIGKAMRETTREVARTAATLRSAAVAATRGGDEWVPADGGPGGEGLLAFEVRIPVGIVAAITPFNAPLNLTAHKVAAAIAAGNTVIVKPPSRAPLPAIRLAEILVKAGLPPGAISVLPGGPPLAEMLVGHPDVGFVSFTGGRAAGDAIRRNAGGKRIALELGGNSATVVHEDADLQTATEWLTWGAFGNAGQSCNSAQRVFVHHRAFDAFIDLYVARVASLKAGDPLDPTSDIGCLVTEAEAVRIEALVDAAIRAGAKVLVGGRRTGAIYEPTILVDVPDEHSLQSEEAFGPVVVVQPYESLQEVVRRANSTDYGLTGAVFTRSMSVAAFVAQQLEVGVVNINRSPNYRLDHLPYGGVKASGIGREGPRYAMEEMTDRRLILIDPQLQSLPA